MKKGNSVRNFQPGVIAELGTYVYALRDPRDSKIFYIGKGTGNRVFDHFAEAEDDSISTSKVSRIREIWNEGENVDWFIVRRSIRALVGDESPDNSAEEIEAAIIDILTRSQNGPSLNDQRGKQSSINGLLSSDEVHALGAPAINPSRPQRCVFVFPIQKALDEGRDKYEATRRTWTKSSLMKPGAIAVGLSGGVSKAVFQTERWEQSTRGGSKMMFIGNEINDSELLRKNWTAITGAAGGFWLFGGYLVVEFSGDGRFRFLRGSKDKGFFDLKSD